MRLIGAPLGDTMTALVQQGGDSGNVTISAYDANASISVQIDRQPLAHAPERVGVRVVGWTGFQTTAGAHSGHDQRLTKIRYIVDFGEPGSVYSAPENLLPEWFNRNVGYGPLTAHVYRQAGTYTIRVWAYEVDSDRRAYFEQSITVGTLEEAFDGDTVFVTNSGAQAPAGVVATYTDFASAWSARSGNLRTRILHAAGDTFTGLSNQVIDLRDAEAVHIDCEGGLVEYTLLVGANQGFRFTAGTTVTGPKPGTQLTFANVRVNGDWNDVTEIGHERGVAFQGFSGREHLHHLLFDQCEAINCEMGFGDTGTDGLVADAARRTTLHDCKVIGFRDAGVFAGAIPTYDILGCRVARTAGASGGGSKGGPPFYNAHGPVRLNAELVNSVIIDGSDFYPAAGWDQTLSGYATQQPCLRLNQEGAWGSVTNVQRSALEGGYWMVSVARQNTTNPSAFHTVLLEKINALAVHQTRNFMYADAGGWLLRDLVWNVPDVPSLEISPGSNDQAFQTRTLVQGNNPTTDTGQNDVPVIIDSVTINNQLTDANAPSGNATVDYLEGPAVYTNQTIGANCVVNQPGASAYTPPADYSALTTTETFTPRTPGYFDNRHGNTTLLTQFANPADAAQEAAFPIGDALANTITADQGSTDITGRKRGKTTSPGHKNPVRA